jgi:hypothetical protein
VLEVANGRTGHAQFLVAVLRPGDATLQIERWQFTQNNERGLLEIQHEGSPRGIVRLRERDPHAPALDRLREEIATPGVTSTRPRGLPAEGPAAFLERLAAATATARASESDAATRVAALAELVRGVDDLILLERDALYRVFEGLAAGPWTIASIETLSSRRARAQISGPGAPLRVELTQTRDGWILSDLRIAAPATD